MSVNGAGTARRHVDRHVDRLREAVRDYDPERETLLKGYASSLASYGVGVAALVALGAARGTRLPERIGWSDLALVGVATHRISRTLAKESVTSPLRAPFTRFRGPAGNAELHEEVTADGRLHAVGELLTCPFCLAQWIATGLVAGLVLAPRPTRVVATTFSAVALSDALQLAYAKLQQAA
jgi:hypothetical protein